MSLDTSLDEAKKQVSYCCATLCEKDVVANALPKISYEDAVHSAMEAEAGFSGFDPNYVYWLIDRIYGKQ